MEYIFVVRDILHHYRRCITFIHHNIGSSERIITTNDDDDDDQRGRDDETMKPYFRSAIIHRCTKREQHGHENVYIYIYLYLLDENVNICKFGILKSKRWNTFFR
jgi:hypothetical protein